MHDLFASLSRLPAREEVADGALLLRSRVIAFEDEMLAALAVVLMAAPFRHMTTPGGFVMLVAMTDCGTVGRVTDRMGYRYDRNDPETGSPWPAMPSCFLRLATEVAAEAGYGSFAPDTCLISRHEPGARLSLHQDKNEATFAHPIVAVSLGLSAVFQLGELMRTDPIRRHKLHYGAVVGWDGPSRLFYHGIQALKDGEHPKPGRMRVNLTLRGAL